MKYFLSLFCMLLFAPLYSRAQGDNLPVTSSGVAGAIKQDNTHKEQAFPARLLLPFDSLLHRSYAENRERIDTLSKAVIYMNPDRALAILDSLEQYAAHNKDKSLALEAKLLNAYYCYLHRIPIPEVANAKEWNTYRFKAILKRAREENNIPMELQAYYWLGISARNDLANYEQLLEYCRMMRRTLHKITQSSFPEKASYMLVIANTYLEFKDYDRAIEACEEILKCDVTPQSENFIVSAKNSLGICYHNKQMLDSADYWFGQVLTCTDASRWLEWEGIASSNLGVNSLLRGDTLQAVPLLQLALNRALEYNDIGMIVGNALYLAEIDIENHKLSGAAKHLATACKYIYQGVNHSKMEQFYRVSAKYYILTGDKYKAVAYQDSVLMQRDKYDKDFSALMLLRMEQKDHIQEQRMKEEKLRLRQIQLNSLVIILILACIFLTAYIYLYRKKRRAYRELVNRTQQWANNLKDDKLLAKNAQNEKNNEKYQMIMNRLYDMIKEDKIYKTSDLTLDVVAERLNVNRVYLSQAINQTTGGNFTTFINENRIKEAIRMFSEQQDKTLSLDGIAFETGFNDRVSFYRAFKKITGLSPTEFKKSRESL